MSDATPFTDRYIVDVHDRGRAFIRYLPGNTALGKDAAGAPGARFPRYPTSGAMLRYELAPAAVRAEVGFELAKDNAAAAVWSKLTELGEATSRVLGDGLAAIGLPLHVIGLLVVLVAYLMLQQAGVVPSIRKVLS